MMNSLKNSKNILIIIIIIAIFLYYWKLPTRSQKTNESIDNSNSKINNISMFDSAPGYSNIKLVVSPGTTVVWTNNGGIEHTVTSAKKDSWNKGNIEVGNEFHSGYVKPGQKFSFKFVKKGWYPYFCIPHKEWMRGEIIVK